MSDESKGLTKWKAALIVGVGAAALAGGALLAYYVLTRNRDPAKADDGQSSTQSTPTTTVSATNDKPKTGTPATASQIALDRARALKQQGNEFFKQQKYQEAIKCYQEAITVCPAAKKEDLAIFHQNLAAVYDVMANRTSDPDLKTSYQHTVLENCTLAFENNPRYVKAMMRRLKAYEALGKRKEAILDVTRVLVLDETQGGSLSQTVAKLLKDFGHHEAKENFPKLGPLAPSKYHTKTYFESFCWSDDLSEAHLKELWCTRVKPAATEGESHVDDEMGRNASETTKEHESQVTVLTLEILPIIKDAQGQHGLRHGDYQRYRQYCQRRLRRLYKTMHFQHGSRHAFKSKKVTQELLKDVKYLHIPLMDAERAWSHAMELKLLANTELRKKFHYIRRLRKAASHAGQLEELCYAEACDARTKLEAQAYASFMKGSVSIELQNWKEALEFFRQAKTIYEKLAGAFSEEQRGMYVQRVEEITPNISYCAYNLKEGTADINDLMQLRLSATAAGGTHDPVLTAKIDEVIAQTRDKEAASMTEVSWRGHTVPVKNEKVRSFILHAQQSARELDRAETLDSKLTLYDNLLMECKDALQAIKDELKGDTSSGKTRSQKTETQIGNMQFLHTYITYIRLSKTVERNLLMAESMKSNLPSVVQNSVEEMPAESGSAGRKTAKPEDLVRIYDTILQNLSDIADLPGIDQDLTFSKEIAAKILQYKAQRCLFVAHSYLLAKKWREAVSLYTRVLSHATSAITHFQELDSPQTQVINSLQELIQQARGFKCSAHASYILEREVVAEEMADMSLNEKPLSSRLDHFVTDPTLTSKKPQVIAFPPDFEPVPCKPLFFDLALNQVQFPSLTHRVEEKKAAGLAGYFKGWLWGSGS